MKHEKKLIFIGPMGAGKTTAINTISDDAPISTEAKNSHRGIVDKATTTVAMDYGRINLSDGDDVHLYGIPGQVHFNFVWPVVARGALGAILLIDCSQKNWLDSLDLFLENFDTLLARGSIVIALNRADNKNIQDCFTFLKSRKTVLPVFKSDPRSRTDMLLLLEAIIANAEVEDYL